MGHLFAVFMAFIKVSLIILAVFLVSYSDSSAQARKGIPTEVFAVKRLWCGVYSRAPVLKVLPGRMLKTGTSQQFVPLKRNQANKLDRQKRIKFIKRYSKKKNICLNRLPIPIPGGTATPISEVPSSCIIDDRCNGEPGETRENCPADCAPCDEDLSCESQLSETVRNCPSDCPSVCVDQDGDGASFGEECLTSSDCNDGSDLVGPDQPERCGNQIDDNCNGNVDEGCQAAAYCPYVAFEDSTLLVNGQRHFPTGFWGYYFDEPGDRTLGQVNFGMSSYVTRPHIPSGYLLNEFLRQHNKYLFLQTGGEPEAVAEHDNYKNAIAIETVHEPHLATQADIAAIIQNINDIRAHDSCNRPVILTPSTGDIPYISEVAPAVDAFVIQAGYVTPRMPIALSAGIFESAKVRAQQKPIFAIINVTHYQPNRYRALTRAISEGELRAQTFLTLIQGASGVFFYNWLSGVSDLRPGEPESAHFSLFDSPNTLAAVSAVRDKIELLQDWLLGKRTGALQVRTDNPNIVCSSRLVQRRDGAREPQVLCVNVAQQASQYFASIDGAEVWRMRAGLEYGPSTFPPNLGGAPGLFSSRSFTQGSVLMQEVSLPVPSLSDVRPDAIAIEIQQASANATFSVALYEDDLRDGISHQRLLMHGPLAAPQSGGIVRIPLQGSFLLKHTTQYYLLVQVNQGQISFNVRDIRWGAFIRDQNPNQSDTQTTIPFLENFGVNLQGLSMQASITIAGHDVSRWCVERIIGDERCEQVSSQDNKLEDTFFSFAVHRYRPR